VVAFALAVAVSFLPGHLSQEAAAQTGQPVVYEGARLITGDGISVIENGAFVVRDGAIEQIGARNAVKAPSGARHVDLSGKTVMPLLIDVHGHIGYMKDATTDKSNYSRENVLDHLHRYMYYGVGAMQSLGTDREDVELKIRNEQRAGTLKDPSLALMFTADRGLVAPTPGQVNGGAAFATDVLHEVSSVEDAREFVRAEAAKKPDLIKFWVDDRNHTKVKLTPALYGPSIDQAHKLGFRAVAHVYYLDDAKELVRSGINGFAHLVRDMPEDDELVKLIKEHNVFACTTMSVQRNDTANWIDDPALAETVRPGVIAQVKAGLAGRGAGRVAGAPTAGGGQGQREGGPPPGAGARGQRGGGNGLGAYADLEGSLRKLNAAGAHIVMCGDDGFATQFPGFTEHRELKGMVDAGLTPLQAIHIATQNGAETLALEYKPMKDRGTLARGKRADFIVLDANPLDDIVNTRKISAVYHDGIAVDRATLRAAWTGSAQASVAIR
jgi:imidazolonepropionase-like amidohydrolase